jgi:hypothetical protein
MAWKTGRANIDLDFSDMSGGVANAFPAHSLRANQVADGYNALFEKRGYSRAPGLSGISDLPLFDAPVRGWFIYRQAAGTEVLIAISNKKIYTVDLTAGTKTQIGSDLAGDGECYAVNSHGKLFIVNGVDFVKIENDLSVYRVGIVAPVGFTASATGSGTLPVGACGVALSYTRKVSGTTVLHSAPQVLSPVTMSGSNLLRIVTTASTDPQVTHITAWLTDAGGSVYYFYGDTANATGNFDIASNANRNPDLVMYERAAGNQLPSGITKLYAMDGRLVGLKSVDHQIYYTMKAQNVYDLERWSTEFHIPTIPVVIISLHSVGSDMIINTSLGPWKLPNFDVSAKPIQIISGAQSFGEMLYFPESASKAVHEYNNLLFGLTNDGYRYFDGEKFSIDFSQHVKPWFDKVMQNIDNFPICSVIYRRSGKRTEIQLSYNDSEISVDNYNQTLVLNLDRLVISDNDNYSAPWEKWGNGFKYAVVTSQKLLCVIQSMDSQGVVAIQAGQSDIKAISEQGVFNADIAPRLCFVRTRTSIDELMGFDVWKILFWMAKLQGQANGKIVLADRDNVESGVTMNRDLVPNQPILDGPDPLVLPFILSKDSIATQSQGLQDNAAGNAVYIEIEQTADDPTFFVYALQLYGYHKIESIPQ